MSNTPCPLKHKVNSFQFRDQTYYVRDERIENVELSLGRNGVDVVIVYGERDYTDLAFCVPYVDNKTDYAALSDIFIGVLELNRAIIKSLDMVA